MASAAILIAGYGCTAEPDLPKPFKFSANGYTFAVAPAHGAGSDTDIPIRLEVKLDLSVEELLSQAAERISQFVVGDECGLKISGIKTSILSNNNTKELLVKAGYLKQICSIIAVPNVICEKTWVKIPFGIKVEGPPSCQNQEQIVTKKEISASGIDIFNIVFNEGKDIRKFDIIQSKNSFGGDADAATFFVKRLREEIGYEFSSIEAGFSTLFAGTRLGEVLVQYGPSEIIFHEKTESTSSPSALFVIFSSSITREEYFSLQKEYGGEG
ncbi:hypothetical protein BC374_03650 [Ensifer sp. LC13]|nr:hypothetical protein BC362_23775 [Ensifer sp. LC14]OCP09649.1 hypothetical protein BC374_03650 [Ensifer sp. LC13]OCP30695.1 hypothetical protein BC364_24940 [Ensifer sp. LC499]